MQHEKGILLHIPNHPHQRPVVVKVRYLISM